MTVINSFLFVADGLCAAAGLAVFGVTGSATTATIAFVSAAVAVSLVFSATYAGRGQ